MSVQGGIHSKGKSILRGWLLAGTLRTAALATAAVFAAMPAVSQTAIDRSDVVFADNGMMEVAVTFCVNMVVHGMDPDIAAEKAGAVRNLQDTGEALYNITRDRDPTFGHYLRFWVDRDMDAYAQEGLIPVDPGLNLRNTQFGCEVSMMGLDPADEARFLPTLLAYLEALHPGLAYDTTLGEFRPVGVAGEPPSAGQWHGRLRFVDSTYSGDAAYYGVNPRKPTATFQFEISNY